LLASPSDHKRQPQQQNNKEQGKKKKKNGTIRQISGIHFSFALALSLSFISGLKVDHIPALHLVCSRRLHRF
jgi:hypothetical protein